MSPAISDESDLGQHVHVGDVLAACRGVRDDVQAVLNVHVARTSESVQGFTSLMLRVTATVRLHDCSTAEIKLVFKQLPTMPNQLEHVKKSYLFQRELTYFRDVVPRLTCPVLPLVEGLVAHESTLVMQYLCEAGFKPLCENFQDMGRDDLVTLSHVLLVVRSLAKLHTASLKTDWLQVIPQLYKTDPMLVGSASKVFENMVRTGCRTVSLAMRELSPQHAEYATWLLGPGCYEEMRRLAVPDPAQLNVLCHGDLHFNNMMFSYDTEGRPVAVRFYDLQFFRHVHPSRDLLYLLYSSVGRDFRLRHETKILQTYVEAFNAATCSTPDPLTLDNFLAEYESSRMFGVAIAMVLRPMMFREAALPDPGQELTEEIYQNTLYGDTSADTPCQMQTNPSFRAAMSELVQETVCVLNRTKISV